eukprot:gene9832-biopygen2534
MEEPSTNLPASLGETHLQVLYTGGPLRPAPGGMLLRTTAFRELDTTWSWLTHVESKCAPPSRITVRAAQSNKVGAAQSNHNVRRPGYMRGALVDSCFMFTVGVNKKPDSNPYDHRMPLQ